MREMKFRAWQKSVRKMFQSTMNHYLSFNGRLFWQFGFDTFEPMEDEDFVLMQYTGLKDKNGKEIYEGDIVLCHYSKENLNVYWSDEEGSWNIYLFGHEEERLADYLKDEGGCEVIGNIYENPELIKNS